MIDIKENGKKIKKMDMENIVMEMVIYMKDNF